MRKCEKQITLSTKINRLSAQVQNRNLILHPNNFSLKMLKEFSPDLHFHL